MIIRAKAPLRISFCGGGTDVDPYPREKGGAVLSATIDRFAYASMVESEEPQICIRSLDYDLVARYQLDEVPPFNGELDLAKAVLRHFSPRRGL
ncbi:MAG TPA: GHMP kinase, partial [bacterium]|nr:GHMP kinase [bacterium]